MFPLANSMFEDVWSRQAPPSVAPIERSNMVKKTIYSEASGIYLVQKLDKGNFLARTEDKFDHIASFWIVRHLPVMDHQNGWTCWDVCHGFANMPPICCKRLSRRFPSWVMICSTPPDNANSQLWSQRICNEFLMLQCVAISWNGHPMQLPFGTCSCHPLQARVSLVALDAWPETSSTMTMMLWNRTAGSEL